MGEFLNEYGKIIVVIIVIAGLIGLGMAFKTKGMNNANWSFDSFMKVANTAVNEAKNEAVTDAADVD